MLRISVQWIQYCWAFSTCISILRKLLVIVPCRWQNLPLIYNIIPFLHLNTLIIRLRSFYWVHLRLVEYDCFGELAATTPLVLIDVRVPIRFFSHVEASCGNSMWKWSLCGCISCWDLLLTTVSLLNLLTQMFLIVSLVLNVIILLLLLLMQGLALQVPVVLWCRLWRLLFVLLKSRRVRHIFNGDQTRIRAIH